MFLQPTRVANTVPLLASPQQCVRSTSQKWVDFISAALHALEGYARYTALHPTFCELSQQSNVTQMKHAIVVIMNVVRNLRLQGQLYVRFGPSGYLVSSQPPFVASIPSSNLATDRTDGHSHAGAATAEMEDACGGGLSQASQWLRRSLDTCKR